MKHNNLFIDYINNINLLNFHEKKINIYSKFKDINNIKNIIIYGPPGVGKYSQSLYLIKRFSPSSLKYEKKINVISNKSEYILKISDIHYEIDMSLLGCNYKHLWHDIFLLINDIISTKKEMNGIILCKNFHYINNELLDIFYSYMQKNIFSSINIKFILITESISFINENILNCCEIINYSRPSKHLYNKYVSLNKLKKIKDINKIININDIKLNNDTLELPYYNICNSIINIIINYKNNKNIDLLKNRIILYDIFILDLNIYDCINNIICTLITRKYINNNNINPILLEINNFIKYYNNNYRPIFHLERIILFIINKIYNTEN